MRMMVFGLLFFSLRVVDEHSTVIVRNGQCVDIWGRKTDTAVGSRTVDSVVVQCFVDVSQIENSQKRTGTTYSQKGL